MSKSKVSEKITIETSLSSRRRLTVSSSRFTGGRTKRVATLWLLLAGSLGCLAQGSSVPPLLGASVRIDQIKQRGVLRVAVLAEFPWLLQSTDAKGTQLSGPAWTLARVYARLLGVKLETVIVTNANKVSILDTGAADITIAPLLATPARLAAVDMIDYSETAQCLFGRAKNEKINQIRTLDELNHSDVIYAFIEKTPQEPWLRKRLPQATARGIEGAVTDIPVQEILSNRADVAPIDKFFFADLVKKYPSLVSVPIGTPCLASSELTLPIGMAVQKGQQAFTAWLRAVAEENKSEVQAEQAHIIATAH